jgi:hypothetical protein
VLSQLAGDFPDWRAESEKRLRFSMLLSAAIVAVVLSMIRLPPPAEMLPLLELVVELTRIEPVAEPEPEPEVVPPPLPPAPAEPLQEQVVPEPLPAPPPAAEAQDEGDSKPTDWIALRDEAIKFVLDAIERERKYTVNPAFEKLRAEASVRFRASLAPAAANAWDQVEKDQLGRTLLRLGDGSCFRVLDDPSAVNRWAFETFDQNIVYCDFFFGGKEGKELPWVEIIKERYPYLRNPVPLP